MKNVSGVLILSMLLLSLHGQEPEQREVRRNPFLELNSYFEFYQTGDPIKDWKSLREWTATDGRTMKAKIVEVEDGVGDFLLAGNQTAQIPLSRFSEKDQRFVAEWQQMSRFFHLGYKKSRDVTNSVQAGISDGAFAKEGKIHETRNFRFESDEPLNSTTVKDFSRMFEATLATVRALPLGLEVAEPEGERFLVRLFANKDNYYKAGGPTTSAGVYILKSREILVPFESLGLKRAGKTYRKAVESDPSTLVHEITHAVTHQWLNYMPMWVAEGLADYVAAIPYRDGTFFLNQHEEGIYKMVATNFGGDAMRFAILKPGDFVYLDSDEYMARPSEPEKPIQLSAVEPYQIRLVGDSADPDPTVPISKSTPMTSVPMVPGSIVVPVVIPPVPLNPSSVVVQRYSSSMLLIHELISGGQVENLRKYLFAHLYFNWDSEKYIADYNRNLDEYQSKVKQQITEFDKVLKDFNDAIHVYNDIVKLKNAGSDVALPPIPENPVAPKPVAVPEILANPRSSKAFSRQAFRKSSVDQYLELPENLSL